MWFLLSIVALLCWSGSDLFSKIGSKQNDKLSHWKMAMAVGLVMGVHAGYELLSGSVTITWQDIWTYMPASALYVLSMILGYVGLRYIELSVSSPICNSSGAIAAILCFIFLQEMPNTWQWIGVACVALGVVALGASELTESDMAREMRQRNSKVRYDKSWIALLFPILYCLIDASGTFIDSVLLREEATGTFLDAVFPNVLEEGVANVAYELTWFAVGIVAAIYVLAIRRDRLHVKDDGEKLIGGVFETAGQLAYVYAIGDTAHVGFAAAIISAYCAASVLWSRIFLKEKLSWKHYASIALAVTGIVILGIFDELGGAPKLEGANVRAENVCAVQDGETLYRYDITVGDLPDADGLIGAKVYLTYDTEVLSFRNADGLLEWTVDESNDLLIAEGASETAQRAEDGDVVLTLWFVKCGGADSAETAISFATDADGGVSTLYFLVDGETVGYEAETVDGSITFGNADAVPEAMLAPILRLCPAV